MESLKKPPVAEWGSTSGCLQQVYYQGEPLDGKPLKGAIR